MKCKECGSLFVHREFDYADYNGPQNGMIYYATRVRKVEYVHPNNSCKASGIRIEP